MHEYHYSDFYFILGDIQILTNHKEIILSPDRIEDDTVIFTCNISVRFPYVTISDWVWLFENNPLESSDRYQIEEQITSLNKLTAIVTSIMQIIEPRKADEGRYDCTINYSDKSCTSGPESVHVNVDHYLKLEGNY